MTDNPHTWPFGEILRAVMIGRCTASESEQMVLDIVEFQFTTKSVLLSVDSATDEIVIDVPSTRTLEKLVPFEKHIGRTLVSVWEATNDQGYLDVVLLGLKYAHPTVGVVAEASALKMFECDVLKIIGY